MQASDSSPLRVYSFRAHIEMLAPCVYLVFRRENTWAVLAPGQPSNKSATPSMCFAGNSHEVPLHKIAEQEQIVLEGGPAGAQGVFHMAKDHE